MESAQPDFGFLEGYAHFQKSLLRLLNKVGIDQFQELIFIENIKLVNLVGLFQQPLFKFYEVAVVPGEERDLHIPGGNFSD
jgi:hypothetical protein